MTNYSLPSLFQGALLGTIIGSALVLPAHAQTQMVAQSKAVAECQALENDIARLACYDRLFGTIDAVPERTSAQTPMPAPTIAPKASATTATKLAQTPAIPNVVDMVANQKAKAEPDLSGVSLPALAPKPAPAAPAAPVNTSLTEGAEASFGAEQLVSADPSKVVTSIQASVVDITKSIRGLRTFILDNGQQWRESESNRLSIKKGQVVTLEKGALSAYYLSKKESGRNMRVKRIK